VQQSFPENPDPAREKSIEAPNLPNPRFHPLYVHLPPPEDTAMIPNLVAYVN
jgi:hypothetical protein